MKIIPIDLLAYPNVRSKISSSFNATSRDKRTKTFTNQSSPVEIGKYRPRFEAIEPALK